MQTVWLHCNKVQQVGCLRGLATLQASNLLNFVAVEPHCLYNVVPWSLNTCFTQCSPVHRVQMHSASNRDTHLYLLHKNSSVHPTTRYVCRTEQIINGMWSGGTTPQDPAFSSLIPAPPRVTLSRRAWVRFDCLRTRVGHFCSCLYKWGMVSPAACECGAEEQTVDNVVLDDQSIDFLIDCMA